MDVGWVKSALLAPVRRGPRTVIWPSPSLGFANHLYLWQAAWIAQRAGRDCRVRHDPRMDPWFGAFPRLSRLDVPRAEVRFRDRRDLYDHQVFGGDFTSSQLEGFVREVLLSAPALGGRLPPDDPGGVTLNVRRGDYYSVPRFRGLYSFDVVGYVREALALARAQADVTAVHVVSDGMDWCRDRLGWIADDGTQLTFAPESESPVDHFVRLCGSRRLVLANSTFSYWGAYVSTVLHGENHADVVAPWFHRRDIDGGRAWQLDPRWSVVRRVPGGWDA